MSANDQTLPGGATIQFKTTSLCRRILRLASQGMLAQDFMSEVSQMVVQFSRCDAVEIRIVDRGMLLCSEALSGEPSLPYLTTLEGRRDAAGLMVPASTALDGFEAICAAVSLGDTRHLNPYLTEQGSFWSGSAQEALDSVNGRTDTESAPSRFQSLAIIPFTTNEANRCLFILKSEKVGFIGRKEVEAYEDTAKMLGIAWTQRRAQLALRERVKEVTCLYGIAKMAGSPSWSLEHILRETVNVLPSTFLYREVASACVELDGTRYATSGFSESPYMQVADIVVADRRRGRVMVAYSKKVRDLDEGPFLKEERRLIGGVAAELALLIEARQTEVLKEQLRHADRLATIGTLAAGVAHELNEPLASILGRAQLTVKVDGLPEDVRRDNEKIVIAALHAREIISKLRLFARQSHPRRGRVNLNEVVTDGLFLVESRCEKAGIALVRELDPDLPEIVADVDQLYQVLVNLSVNAVQATPDGGRLTIRTHHDNDEVVLSVEDTGSGIRNGDLKQIFTPFYTTKEADGTGLGLSVVHGIVSAHGGRVDVRSALGRGSRFDVRLPLEPPVTLDVAEGGRREQR